MIVITNPNHNAFFVLNFLVIVQYSNNYKSCILLIPSYFFRSTFLKMKHKRLRNIFIKKSETEVQEPNTKATRKQDTDYVSMVLKYVPRHRKDGGTSQQKISLIWKLYGKYIVGAM